MFLLQPKRTQVNIGWSKTDSKYGFAPTKETSSRYRLELIQIINIIAPNGMFIWSYQKNTNNLIMIFLRVQVVIQYWLHALSADGIVDFFKATVVSNLELLITGICSISL